MSNSKAISVSENRIGWGGGGGFVAMIQRSTVKTSSAK